MDNYILGISCFYHDSAAAILRNGEVVAAAQEERFTRIKHDAAFPQCAIGYCLEEAKVKLDELEAVVFYDKPLLKFERLLETYYAYAPLGLISFLKAMPVWMKEKIFLKREIKNGLQSVQQYDRKKLKLLFTEHHLSHGASSFFVSPYEEAAILTIDGVGEWATASIGWGKGNKIQILKELHFPNSLGLLYSAFTYYLGFRVNSGEYKLMGLAPYGNPKSSQTQQFVDLIKTELITIKNDGSISLNQKYFDYAIGLKMVKEKKWEQLFGISRKSPEEVFTSVHLNLAFAIQQVTEEVVMKMAEEAQRLTGQKNLCLSGGVALNCVANGKLATNGPFENIYIQPAAGDAGGALGAALAVEHIYFGRKRSFKANKKDAMKGTYLGPEADQAELDHLLQIHRAVCHEFESVDQLTQEVASLLDQGYVVGWCQGRMEFGPRALGNRSILGDPRNPDMQRKINQKIKYRESFRPFAPAVLEEDAWSYFEMSGDSPYMLQVQPVAKQLRQALPDDYHKLSMWDRLDVPRSELQSITHVDLSARVQTVSKETNPKFWQLIDSFKQLTGCSVVINTSFNVRGEPIVCTAEDAYRCFMRTEMDYLVINNCLFGKQAQPKWKKQDRWQEEFVLD
ncbi:carbamoyltransferase [Reichenbachiella faecimaris]|uniref:Carbamoyltransferase n=1 Tax=Reichenbachiella faecimaris TaxID=692418 RepID=A0A1W2G7V3_REIFA|nr:carbamoyltransferase [Reichenbachiella faecimaris]SMD32770.1 carbamoyltransferase [Reichenbachiella faecimaris]